MKVNLLKPIGKIKVSKVFVNKNNGQVSITLPKRKMNGYIPSKVEITYW